MNVKKIEYGGWPNCYRLSNDQVDLVVTTDVGPRIIRFGFIDEENEFREFKEMLGKTGGDEWLIYGGHRLWHAPEQKPRTYFPDNGPVDIEEHNGMIRLIQPTEPTTGIQKEIDIQLAPDAARVTVTHRLINHNLWSIELAPWALSVMARGGRAILPLPPYGSHEENLLPSNSFTLWAYTQLSDPRWTWGSRTVFLDQDPQAESPQKIGALLPDGWAGYARNGHLFLKTFGYVPQACYPDMGCNFETFTNAEILEMESVGPVVKLAPEMVVEHVERWGLYKDVPIPESDADVEKTIAPKADALMQ